MFISGDPGIGKSRLTSELRAAACDAGDVDWIEGRGVSYGAALAWWPVRDLLRRWLGVGTQEPELRTRLGLKRRLEELFGGRAADVEPFLMNILGLAPERDGAAAIAALSPEALQFRTYEVVGELIGTLAARRPLVVAVDDLHWADATSIGLLDRLLGLAETAPILFLLSHRAETAHPSWALRERAQREFRHLLSVIELARLDADAERRLLAAVAEGTLSTEVQDRVISYAEGNPLFLEEMARAIGEGGARTPEAVTVPATLLNWLAHVPDPAYFLNALFESASRANSLGVADPGFDRLLRLAAAEMDGAQRMARYHEADRVATADLFLAMPIVYGSAFSILQPWVRGWWEWGNPNQLFSEVLVDRSSS